MPGYKLSRWIFFKKRLFGKIFLLYFLHKSALYFQQKYFTEQLHHDKNKIKKQQSSGAVNGKWHFFHKKTIT